MVAVVIVSVALSTRQLTQNCAENAPYCAADWSLPTSCEAVTSSASGTTPVKSSTPPRGSATRTATPSTTTPWTLSRRRRRRLRCSFRRRRRQLCHPLPFPSDRRAWREGGSQRPPRPESQWNGNEDITRQPIQIPGARQRQRPFLMRMPDVATSRFHSSHRVRFHDYGSWKS